MFCVNKIHCIGKKWFGCYTMLLNWELENIHMLLCFRTFKDIIGGLVFDCSHKEQPSHDSKSEWGALQHYFLQQLHVICACKRRYKLISVFLASRSDKDPELLSSSNLSDFQIICSLAVGEFGHVDLVRVDLIAAHTHWHRPPVPRPPWDSMFL